MTRLSLPNGRIELVYPPPPEDDVQLQRIWSNPISLEHLPFFTPPTLEGVVERRTKRSAMPDQYRDFRIHRKSSVSDNKEDGTHVFGGTGFLNMDLAMNQSSEVGIGIDPDLHRQGYASEALFLLLDYGFRSSKPESSSSSSVGSDDVGAVGEGSSQQLGQEDGLNLHRVTFVTAASNFKMRRWLEVVLGASQEAVYRKAWKNLRGAGEGEEYAWVDAIGYSLLKSEWQNAARANLESRVLAAIKSET